MTEEIKSKLTTEKSKEVAIVDAVFMCDCTGSMGTYMSKAKDTVSQILTDIKNTYSEASVFFAFIAYRDHCDKNVIEFKDLTGDVEDVINFISKQAPDGGGDEAEAVVDGLYYAAKKVSWRPDALRQLIHILDAPPHGREFGGGDDHPDGCPCGYDYRALLKELDKMEVEYMVLNFNSSVDKMVNIYKKYHSKIECVPLVLDTSCPQQEILCDIGASCRGLDCEIRAEEEMCFEQSEPDFMQQMPEECLMRQAMPKKAMPSASPYSGMDITSQVACQMSENISQTLLSKVTKKFQKKS